MACLQLLVQLCELPMRQLVHSRSCCTRGERVTWLRCNDRNSGFEPVQSHNCRVSSAHQPSLPRVAVSSAVDPRPLTGALLSGGARTTTPQWRDQAKPAVRVASWGALGRGILTRAIHDDWTDVRNDRSQSSPASGGVVSVRARRRRPRLSNSPLNCPASLPTVHSGPGNRQFSSNAPGSPNDKLCPHTET